MLRLIAFLVAIALVAAGLAWLADRPGELVVEWQGYHAETSVFRAIVLLVVLVAIALTCWYRRKPTCSPVSAGPKSTCRRAVSNR